MYFFRDAVYADVMTLRLPADGAVHNYIFVVSDFWTVQIDWQSRLQFHLRLCQICGVQVRSRSVGRIHIYTLKKWWEKTVNIFEKKNENPATSFVCVKAVCVFECNQFFPKFVGQFHLSLISLQMWRITWPDSCINATQGQPAADDFLIFSGLKLISCDICRRNFLLSKSLHVYLDRKRARPFLCLCESWSGFADGSGRYCPVVSSTLLLILDYYRLTQNNFGDTVNGTNWNFVQLLSPEIIKFLAVFHTHTIFFLYFRK